MTAPVGESTHLVALFAAPFIFPLAGLNSQHETRAALGLKPQAAVSAVFLTSRTHPARSVKAPRSGVPSVASAMTAFAHCTNAPCDLSGAEPSKVAHGHWRAIAPRTPAMSFASL